MPEPESRASELHRHVVITGGAGFVGSHLAELLVAGGNRVTVIDDLSSGSLENLSSLRGEAESRGAFSFIEGSIFDEPLLDAVFDGAGTVIHLAAAVGVRTIIDNPVDAIETNTLGTRTVLRVARRQGNTVLLASTSEVYGRNGATPFAEDTDCVLGPTTTTRWGYATSKAMSETLAFAYHRQYGVPVTVMRLFNTIGPRQTGTYGMVVPRLVRQALIGEPLTVYGDGAQTRCFCDVQDTVRAIAGLVSYPAAVGGVFNIGSTHELTIRELADAVIDIVGELGEITAPPGDLPGIVLIPYEEAYAEGFEDMRRRAPDVRRIHDAIGWKAEVPLEATLRAVVRHEAASMRAAAKR